MCLDSAATVGSIRRGGRLALIIFVAHRAPKVAEGWAATLSTKGHFAQVIDPSSLPQRPTVLDGVCVDPGFSATEVHAIQRWAGASVVVRLSEEPPGDDWLGELVRAHSPPITLGGMLVDLRRGVVRRPDEILALTDTEALLMAWLATRAGEVVSRGDLLQNVWGYSPNMRTRVVDVTVARLRTKIETDPSKPEHIITVRGKGYRLDGVSVADATDGTELSEVSTTDLVGRQGAWEALHRWFAKADPLLTLLGPPGMGKTALARAFHASVPGAVWCGLQPATTEAEAMALLGEALGLTGGVSEEQLRISVLLGERPLLVLDNAEHLLGLVGRLLSGIPARPVLVTSRVRIGAAEERCFDLAPLTAEDTQALFVQRAREQRHDFDGNDDVLQELASLCEGLPLAVELAAAQVRVLSGPDLVRVLSRRDVRSGRRGGHKSYDEALASSWALLTPDDQELLALLAAIRGDAPMALVESVFDDPLESLSRLTDASLLRIHHAPSGAVVHLLETIRRHVVRTAPVSDRRSLTTGIARHVEQLAERARGAEGWTAVRDLGRLRPAVWGAVEDAEALGDHELAASLALSMIHFYETLGPDAPDLLMLRRVGAADIPSAFAVAHLRALVWSRTGRSEEAQREGRRAAALASTPAEHARSVYVDTMLSLRDRDADPSALEAVLNDLDDVGRYRAFGCLAVLSKIQLRLDAAIEYFERALAIADRTGAGWMETNVLGLLASVYGNAGQWDRAAATADALVEKLDQAGFSRRSELSLQLQRVTRQGLGDLAGAIALQRELIAVMGSRGQLWHQGRLCTALSCMHLDAGEPDQAEEAARKGIRFFRAADDVTGAGHATAALAAARLSLGAVAEARQLAEAQLDNKEQEARDIALEVVVYAALRQGDPQAAAAAVERAEPTEALRLLTAALLAAANGSTACPPESAQAGRFGHRGALAAILGGPSHRARSPREEAVRDGTVGPYPEAELVRFLHDRR